MARAQKTRILIVDDHPIVRQGYLQLIGNHPDMEVCSSVGTEQEALEQAAQENPHLAIVDITLKNSNGIELIKTMRLRHPKVKVLVVSAHDENLYAERALDAGSLGYVNKHAATEHLISAIQKVMEGEIYVSRQITNRILKRRSSAAGEDGESAVIDALTDRELEVFELIGHGQTSKRIAANLHLSPKTIERYKENIKHKLNIANATEMVQQATRWVLEKG